MESPADQCHLLRISRELRNCIYDHVIHLNPPSDTVWDYKDDFDKGRFHTTTLKAPGTNFSIPWVDLLLTCKAISIEIIAYLDLQSNLDKVENRTWTLELATSGGLLKPALWRQIPCYPAKAGILVANLDFTNRRAQFWGDGGPMPIVRQLYQTLNRVLHYGPAFGRQVLLSQPLRLKTLVLRATRGSSQKEIQTPAQPDSSGNRIPTRNYRQLCTFIQDLKRIGILWGCIDAIQIIDEDSHEKQEIVIQFVENAGVPEGWDGYGFEWGR
jgi:hypothetical protein